MSPRLINPPLLAIGPHNEKPVEKLRGCFQDKRKRRLSDPHKMWYQAHGVDTVRIIRVYQQNVSHEGLFFKQSNFITMLLQRLAPGGKPVSLVRID